MKALIFLLFPVLICSQQIEIDTTGLDKETKDAVIKIVNNVKKRNEAQKIILQEKDKKIDIQKKMIAEKKRQDRIWEEIKSYITSVKTNQNIDRKYSPEEFQQILAVRSDEYTIDIPAQEVKFEQLPKRGLNRLFSRKKWEILPYIIDSNGNQIYLKKE